VQDEIELVLQVNGKLRGAIRCPPAPRASHRAAALASEAFAKFGAGAAVPRWSSCPGVVNIVVGQVC
jgi:leucyl-tRNA synthetase